MRRHDEIPCGKGLRVVPTWWHMVAWSARQRLGPSDCKFQEAALALGTAPVEASSLVVHRLPQNLKGCGRFVANFANAPIEAVRWPAWGWSPVDPDTGDQVCAVEGILSPWREREILCGGNRPVDDSYRLRRSREPRDASETAANPDRSQVSPRRANRALPVGDAAL